jgi:hypothetical protein
VIRWDADELWEFYCVTHWTFRLLRRRWCAMCGQYRWRRPRRPDLHACRVLRVAFLLACIRAWAGLFLRGLGGEHSVMPGGADGVTYGGADGVKSSQWWWRGRDVKSVAVRMAVRMARVEFAGTIRARFFSRSNECCRARSVAPCRSSGGGTSGVRSLAAPTRP